MPADSGSPHIESRIADKLDAIDKKLDDALEGITSAGMVTVTHHEQLAAIGAQLKWVVETVQLAVSALQASPMYKMMLQKAKG